MPREHISISPEFRPWFEGMNSLTINSLAHAFGLDLSDHYKRTRVSSAKLTSAHRSPLEAYFKAYATRSTPTHGLARRSRGPLEARNLNHFRRWGIACPKVIAWGHRRRAAGLKSDLSFLVTQTIPGAQALRDFWTSKESPADPEQRLAIIRQLAKQTRQLHRKGFFHQDLKWRNLLVDSTHQVHWIDCPNGYFSKFPLRVHHGRIKDLATLDKVAKDRCTEDERRHFLSVYLETDDPNPLDEWTEAVVSYRRRRQDD